MSKVLVVDDEAAITMQLEERLSQMGYDVVATASSGSEAIDAARHYRPDVVLMDIVMPGDIDGIQASEVIRAEMDIPVIFLTGYGGDVFIQRAAKAGAFGYVVKPFREEDIKAAIEIVLQKGATERRLRLSERRNRAILDAATESIISIDGETNIISWNRGAEAMFGYSESEVIGKPLRMLMPEHSRAGFDSGFRRVTDLPGITPRTADVSGLTRDGSEFSLRVLLTKGETEGGVFYTAFCTRLLPLHVAPRSATGRSFQVLSDAEIDVLIGAQYPLTAIGNRNITILMTLLDTGIKLGEASRLRCRDLHFEEGFVDVAVAAGEQRTVPIGGLCREALSFYIRRFRPEPIDRQNDCLFLTMGGGHLQAGVIKVLLKRWGTKAGVPKLGAQVCRHTFATSFLAHGCGDIVSLQQILGYGSLEMIGKYAEYAATAPAAVGGAVSSPLDQVESETLRDYASLTR